MQSISPSELLRQKRLQLQTNANPKPEWGGLTPRNGVLLPIKISAINNSKFTVTASQKQFTTGKVFSPTGVFTKPSPLAQFSPTNIATLQLWLDAADVNTLSVSGTIVTQWSDKSGLSNHLTGVSSPRSGTATASGLNIVDITAGGYFSRTSFTFPAQYSIFTVAYTSASGTNTLISTTPDVTYLQRRNAIYWGNGTGGWNEYTNAISSSSIVLFGNLNTGSAGTLYTNGNFIETKSGTTSAGSQIGIGNDLLLLNQQWGGYVCEVVVFNTSLSTLQRQQMEGYLAWKWGLQSSLPVGHPYKLAKP